MGTPRRAPLPVKGVRPDQSVGRFANSMGIRFDGDYRVIRGGNLLPAPKGVAIYYKTIGFSDSIGFTAFLK